MLALILTLALIGVVVYLIETYLPMPQPFKVAINVIVLVCVVIYLVQLFNLDIPLPHR
jgi:predicted membrane channel-forming protein YqfA (hemolysin III family)